MSRSTGLQRGSESVRGRSVLVVGVNYWPEMSGIGPYTTLFAEHLAAAGAKVTVLTAPPHYPAWRIADGYDCREVMEERNGVQILRVRPFVPRYPSPVKRALFEASFMIRTLNIRVQSPLDAVVAVVPGLGGAVSALEIARRRVAPCGVIFQDLMGRAASQSGTSGAFVGEMTSRLEGFIARTATGVGVVATAFGEFFLEAGVPANRIVHLPNWSHVHEPTRSRGSMRDQFGWTNKIIALHAGNMGAKQGLENVVAAASLAERQYPNVVFVLMGEGSQRRQLEAAGTGLTNLRFLEPQPSHVFPDVLAAADILLVNERATVRSMSLPSKLTSYFVAGRPVVAAIREDGTTAAELQQAGSAVIVPPEDPEALVNAVVHLASDPARGECLGERGRAYARKYLAESAAAERSIAFVADLLNRSGRDLTGPSCDPATNDDHDTAAMARTLGQRATGV